MKRIEVAALLMMIVALSFIGGCGGSDDAALAAAEPQVDPRFATAEAIVTHFNELNTKLPRDLPNILPLYYLETDFQRKTWQALDRQANRNFYRLEVAVHQQFGEPLFPSKRFRTRACTPAVLTSFSDRRAEGKFKDWLGRERPLHLIQVEGRWWVSGYTLEYETDPDDREFVEGLTDAILELDVVDDGYLAPVIDRVRAGEFASIAEVQDAFIAAARENFERRHGD